MASPVDTSVKHIYADMAGAPSLTGVAGSLISLLDTFLISGFGLKVVDSGAVSGGICRLNFSSGASAADKHAVILVSGATQVAINGEQKLTNYSPSWVEFATALPDGPLSGSINFRMAPLGWEKVFSKTNVAVYRPTDPRGTRPFLRIDDTAATVARVTMYESMTDVDTGFNMMPTAAMIAGGFYWWKRTTAGAVAMQYALAGDSRGFFYAPMPAAPAGATGPYSHAAHYAGDLNSYRSGDAYCATLTGGGSTTSAQSANNSVYGSVFSNEADAHRVLARRSNGIGGAQTCARTAYGATDSGFNGSFGPAPAPVDNGLYLTPIVFADGGSFAATGPRGEVPGALCSIQTGTAGVLGPGLGQIDGTGPHAGKTLLRMQTGSRVDTNLTNIGTGFIDITGPWRK